MRSTLARLPRAALLLLVAAVAAACGQKGAHDGHGGMPPAVVAVQEVQPRTLAVEFEYPAQTAGSREAEGRSRVAGILEKRNYTEGAGDRAGQALFTIYTAPFEAAARRT